MDQTPAAPSAHLSQKFSMSKTYRTAQLAKMTGVHPNTIRLYEEWELIPKPERLLNGYRVFTERHALQCKLVRLALEYPFVQNGLRKKALEIIKTSAAGNYEEAERLTENYLGQIRSEQLEAEEAIEIVRRILSGAEREPTGLRLTRNQTADHLHITMDTLRNWELNGLLTVKRRQNGYRVYTDEDMGRLKMIRALRLANYSLSAILRMLTGLSSDPHTNIKKIIDTPDEEDGIISVYDMLLTSLRHVEENILQILELLKKMKNPPY